MNLTKRDMLTPGTNHTGSTLNKIIVLRLCSMRVIWNRSIIKYDKNTVFNTELRVKRPRKKVNSATTFVHLNCQS